MTKQEREGPGRPNDKLEAWIKKTNMSPNQLAAASGLSPSYLNELRKGILRVNRKKLLALGCGPGLDTKNINELLDAFRSAPIDERDISEFVETAKTRHLSEKGQPLYGDGIYLLLLGVESKPGNVVAVVDTPSYILRSSEYVEFEKRKQGYDDLHIKIVKSLHEGRKLALESNIEKYSVEVYVSEEDMARYIKRYDYFSACCAARKQVNYILDHLVHVFQFIKDHPNYHLYLGSLPHHSFEFELKFTPENNGEEMEGRYKKGKKKEKVEKSKVFYIAAEHADPRWMRKDISGDQVEPAPTYPALLDGYATDDKQIFTHFKGEYLKIKDRVTMRSDRPDELMKLKEHVVQLFKQETQIGDDQDNLRLLDSLLSE